MTISLERRPLLVTRMDDEDYEMIMTMRRLTIFAMVIFAFGIGTMIAMRTYMPLSGMVVALAMVVFARLHSTKLIHPERRSRKLSR